MANLSCLDNLIGIRGECGTPTTPTSGLYIQDLPGIDIALADATINEEQKSGFDLIQNKITFAENYILNDIRNHFSDKLKVSSVIENDTVGYYQDNLQAVASEAGQLKGIRLDIEKHPYLTFFLGSVWLQVDTTGSVDVEVWDLISGTKLDTLTVSAVADTPTELVVNKEYHTNKQNLHLFIGYEATVGSYKSTIHSSDNGCVDCARKRAVGNRYITFTQAKLATSAVKVQKNLKSLDNTAGLSFSYSLNCSLEPFICTLANRLAWAILHKAGAEILRETQYSRRLNSIVQLHSKDATDLREEFEMEYDKFMSGEKDVDGIARKRGFLNSIEMPNNECFKCTQAVKSTVRVP